jgi:hypothetical protein
MKFLQKRNGGQTLSDIKWSIIIDSIAALGLFISLFFFEPFFCTRIVGIFLALSQIFVLLFRENLNKIMYLIYSMIVFIAFYFAGQYDSDVLKNAGKTFLLYAFVFSIIMSTYRTIYNKQLNS